jgi:predicted metal-binding membrane protein
MELNDALVQIAEIRQRMAQGQTYRGYRSATTLLSAVLALTAAAVQHFFLGDDAWTGVLVWVSVAVASTVPVAAGMVLRYRRTESTLQREMTLVAAEQFAPSLVAGGLLAYVITAFFPERLEMLPGLWALLFSMGVFASRRVLPRGTGLVGAYYLLAGVAGLALEGRVPFGWRMAMAFGPGQLLAGFVLYWNQERRRAAA